MPSSHNKRRTLVAQAQLRSAARTCTHSLTLRTASRRRARRARRRHLRGQTEVPEDPCRHRRRPRLLAEEQRAQADAVRESIVAGAEITGRVASVRDFGAFIDLSGGVQGRCMCPRWDGRAWPTRRGGRARREDSGQGAAHRQFGRREQLGLGRSIPQTSYGRRRVTAVVREMLDDQALRLPCQECAARVDSDAIVRACELIESPGRT